MSIQDIASTIAQTIQKEANVNAVFGEPRKLDDHTIIPVARVHVSLSGGGGAGSGPAPKPNKSNGEEDESSAAKAIVAALGATGGGGGLDIGVHPLGFIRDTANGAEFVAIDLAPEGLIGKVEHLIKGIRSAPQKQPPQKQPES